MLSTHKQFINVTPDVRIYFTPEEEGQGFQGEIIEAISWGGEPSDISWKLDPADDYGVHESRLIGKVIARFDGLRHLYLGENGEGYIYYPSTSKWVSIFNYLRQLEVSYCREYEG